MTKRAAKFSIFNQNHRCSYHNHKTNDYHCLLQCGVNCNSTETISTEMWKQLETQTKDWKGLDKVWEYIWKHWLGKGNWRVAHLWKMLITLSSNFHLSGHFSNLGRERKKNMLKNPNNTCPTRLAGKRMSTSSPKCLRSDWRLYRKNKCAWCMKGSDKKNGTRKNGKLMRISTFWGWKGFKDTWSLSKMNCCVSSYLRLLKLDLLFRTHLLLVWCIICHVGPIL